MDYNKVYKRIIDNAKSLNRSKKNGYFERHHIIPKCLDGDNSSNNIVLLTAKEHFICHKLLCFIYPNSKPLYFAFWAMCNQLSGDVMRTYKISSRTYNEAKSNFAKVNSTLHKGKKLSTAHVTLITERMLSDKNPMKGKIGELNPLFNRPRPDSVKKRISDTKKLNPTKNASFKGMFVTPKGTFFTLREASVAHNLDASVISERCKGVNNSKVISKKSIAFSKDLLPEHLGKTYAELGWGFIPQPRR